MRLSAPLFVIILFWATVNAFAQCQFVITDSASHLPISLVKADAFFNQSTTLTTVTDTNGTVTFLQKPTRLSLSHIGYLPLIIEPETCGEIRLTPHIYELDEISINQPSMAEIIAKNRQALELEDLWVPFILESKFRVISKTEKNNIDLQKPEFVYHFGVLHFIKKNKIEYQIFGYSTSNSKPIDEGYFFMSMIYVTATTKIFEKRMVQNTFFNSPDEYIEKELNKAELAKMGYDLATTKDGEELNKKINKAMVMGDGLIERFLSIDQNISGSSSEKNKSSKHRIEIQQSFVGLDNGKIAVDSALRSFFIESANDKKKTYVKIDNEIKYFPMGFYRLIDNKAINLNQGSIFSILGYKSFSKNFIPDLTSKIDFRRLNSIARKEGKVITLTPDEFKKLFPEVKY